MHTNQKNILEGIKFPSRISQDKYEVMREIFMLYEINHNVGGLLTSLDNVFSIQEDELLQKVAVTKENPTQRMYSAAYNAVNSLIDNPKLPNPLKTKLEQYKDLLLRKDPAKTESEKAAEQQKTQTEEKEDKNKVIDMIRQQVTQKVQNSSKSLNQFWMNVQKNIPTFKGKTFNQVVDMYKKGEISKEDFVNISASG